MRSYGTCRRGSRPGSSAIGQSTGIGFVRCALHDERDSRCERYRSLPCVSGNPPGSWITPPRGRAGGKAKASSIVGQE